MSWYKPGPAHHEPVLMRSIHTSSPWNLVEYRYCDGIRQWTRRVPANRARGPEGLSGPRDGSLCNAVTSETASGIVEVQELLSIPLVAGE